MERFLCNDKLLFISEVIFAVDVKASFDTYRNCMTAVCDQKTLIITNPGVTHKSTTVTTEFVCMFSDCNEAHQLFQFVQSVEISPECDEDLLDTGIVSGNHQDNSKDKAIYLCMNYLSRCVIPTIFKTF